MSYNTVIPSNTFQRGQPTVATTRESNNNWSYKKERKHYIQQPHDGYYYYCRDDGELKNPSPGFWIKKKSKNLTKLFDWTNRHKKKDTQTKSTIDNTGGGTGMSVDQCMWGTK